MKAVFHVAVLLVSLFLGMDARAQTGETPATIDGATVISAEQAKDLLAKGAKVFDARKKASFAEGHVPGAVSVGSAYDKETKVFDVAVFGANKDQPIIVHGHGTDGWTSVYGVKAAVAAGFKKVHWMRGGWAEWSAKGLPVE